MIPALVLAAGASSRMGRPKALLPVGDRTFVRRIAETLREAGLDDILVIVRPGQDAVLQETARVPGVRAIVNPRAEDGQLSSLITGLDTIDAPHVTAVLVTLVDVPLIAPSTIRTMLERA